MKKSADYSHTKRKKRQRAYQTQDWANVPQRQTAMSADTKG